MWILLALVMATSSLKMRLTLEAEETRCFYQMLMANQKYAIGLVPINEGKYELSIKHQINDSWEHSVYRKVTKPFHNVTLFKLAKHETLYSYCISSLEISPLKLKTEVRWGVQLLDLKDIAQDSDQERLERQAKWIEKQANKIEEVVKSTFIKRNDRDEYANLMRKKMIGYALIGILVLIGISVYFYMNLRKAFHERKMI